MTHDRLRILICIGGGPDAFASLKYAVRLSKDNCANIALVYVRPIDSGLKSGGLDISVARQNLLDWGLELPGMTHLKRARDMLIEMGEIASEEPTEWRHKEISGDPVGEYIFEYGNACGGTISLRLRTAKDVTSAIIDEADNYEADLIIVGASPEAPTGLKKLLAPKPLALTVASMAEQTVIVARHLEPGHGHLVCVQDTDKCRSMLPNAIRNAHACQCPISILSVAPTEEDKPSAQKAIDEAAQAFRESGIEPHELLLEVGDPTEIIQELGYDFSLIVMSESEKPWFAKGFSVSHEVAAKARNSVMIVK